ncbi:MAG: hypothetical protein ACRERY_18550, partial [Pseudomonas sp.]
VHAAAAASARRAGMKRVLVLYYSMYGHIERMAEAAADGSRQPNAKELALARFQGAHVAQLAVRME